MVCTGLGGGKLVFDLAMIREVSLVPSIMSASNSIDQALELMRACDLSSLVTHTFALRDLGNALQCAVDRKKCQSIKVALHI